MRDELRAPKLSRLRPSWYGFSAVALAATLCALATPATADEEFLIDLGSPGQGLSEWRLEVTGGTFVNWEIAASGDTSIGEYDFPPPQIIYTNYELEDRCGGNRRPCRSQTVTPKLITFSTFVEPNFDFCDIADATETSRGKVCSVGTAYFSFLAAGLVTDGGIVTFTPAGGTAVPEPASWSLLITGLGLVGAVMRKRRRVAEA